MATVYGVDDSVGDSVQMKKPHLARRSSGGIPQEVRNLSNKLGTRLGNQSVVITDVVYTNPAAADDDGFLTATASAATATSYSGAGLNGAIGTAVMDPPRQVVATVAGVTPADVAASATITGKDINGQTISETVVLPQVAGSVTSTKCFRSITSITMPAGQGVDGTVKFGTGDRLGLKVAPLVLGTAVVGILAETYDGSVVTNGVLTGAATHGPYGSYLPNTVPNGAHDYAIAYLAGSLSAEPVKGVGWIKGRFFGGALWFLASRDDVSLGT